MSKILYIGWNGYGHVNPSLSLVRKLVEKGHEVVYLNSTEFRELIETTGARYMRNRFLDLLYDFATNESIKVDKCTEEEFFSSVEGFYEKIEDIHKIICELKKSILTIKPDVIIYDSCVYFISLLCGELDIPKVKIITLFATNKSMILEDKNILMDFYNFNLESSAQDVINRMERLVEAWEEKIGFGLDNFDIADSKCDLNLVFTSKEFQPYSDYLDDTYHYIGNDVSFRRSMEEYIDLNTSYEKKILVSFGSILCSSEEYIEFYQRFMKHFKDFKAYFIINIGRLEKDKFTDIPDNFELVQYIPQLSALEQVDLFINHGGFNSISEAILSEVPMIVFPQIYDEFMNARQVESLGMGKQYINTDIDLKVFERDIEDILYNDMYKNNVVRIAKSYRATGGNDMAAELIEAYLDDYNKKLEAQCEKR